MTETAPHHPSPTDAPVEHPVDTPGVRRTPVRRASRQRDAVAARLTAESGFRSAQEIYADLRSGGNSIGLATVYRALQGMVEDGEVDALRSAGDGEAVYRRCSDRHHHHLVCRSCGTAVEVEGGPVERWTQEVAAGHGFTDVRHVMEVFGTCEACAASDGARGPAGPRAGVAAGS